MQQASFKQAYGATGSSSIDQGDVILYIAEPGKLRGLDWLRRGRNELMKLRIGDTGACHCVIDSLIKMTSPELERGGEYKFKNSV